MQNRTAYATDSVLTTTDMQNIQTELATIITAFGGTLSGSDLAQASKAIADAVANSGYYTDSGAADAYILSAVSGSRAQSTLRTGSVIRFMAGNANTGASTINVASLGVKSIKRADGSTALSAGDITDSEYTTLVYDGTVWRLFSFGLLEASNFIGNLTGNVIGNAYGNLNFFDNGGMQIHQRASDYTLVKDVYGFSLDRWAGMATGTAVSAGILTQETSSTLNDSGYSVKFEGATLTGTGILYLRQRIASQDAVKLKNQDVSIQFKVLHDVGSAIDYTIYARKADADNDFTTATDISNSGATSVTTATATIIKYEDVALGDCSNGLEIEVKIECGAITTKNFEITNAKLEISESCSGFIDDVYSKDWERCRKYLYIDTVGIGGKPLDGNSGGYGYGNNLMLDVPINMVKAPTLLDGGNGSVGTLTIYRNTGTPPKYEFTLPDAPNSLHLYLSATQKYASCQFYSGGYDTECRTYGMRGSAVIRLSAEL